MSILEALAKLSDTPEARAASERMAAERDVARDAVLARHGSADAVMAPGPDESLLIAACRPFVEAGRLDAHFAPAPDAMDPEVARAVREAIPFPTTVAALLREYEAWDALSADRSAIDGDRIQPVALGCRERLLEAALDTVPAVDLADVEARLAWMQVVLDMGFSRDVRSDEACLDALRRDLARIASREIALP